MPNGFQLAQFEGVQCFLGLGSMMQCVSCWILLGYRFDYEMRQ
jgi:hypothetical protein